ncbi:hypothetical protein Syun_020711 [Stephania yunnanensis]|uniref:Uncharacterized protein n=1 Tax=Stephania yunnanensis TaxID=152371 RepID=A0AAP0IEB7_9MAGN
MAFLLNKTNLFSWKKIQSQPQQKMTLQPHRAFHIEPGQREKALLQEDPVLKRFKSHKKSVYRVKRIGDVLTIVVVAGCCYEIYVKSAMREDARKQARSNEAA